MAKVRLYVNSGGDVKSLCDGIIDDIPELGDKFIERAANIEYSNDENTWVITHKDGHRIGTAKTHGEAVEKERAHLDHEFRTELLNGR